MTLNQRVPGSSPGAQPSSLPKPRQPSSIGNRPFLRGFSPVSFRVLGLCGHSRSLEAIFCARSLHPEIPFPAAREGLEIASVDQADSLCLVLDNGDLVVLHVITEGEGTANPKPLSFGGSDLVADALGSDLPLKLSEGQKYVECQAAH